MNAPSSHFSASKLTPRPVVNASIRDNVDQQCGAFQTFSIMEELKFAIQSIELRVKAVSSIFFGSDEREIILLLDFLGHQRGLRWEQENG
jgi:hypothetical protein